LDNKNKVLEGIYYRHKRYKQIKKLGEGSQGIVYQVEDLDENNKK
jgi:hypothetical protein